MDRGGLRLASRGRERAWWLLAVAIVAAVLVALIPKIGSTPAWILTCLAAATGLGLLVVELRARRGQDDKTAAVVRENVAKASHRLPRMREVRGEDAGVHHATENVDYVRREVEPEVERLIRVERRVLIVGRSMSGKTRLALQVTKHLYADYRLLVPRNGKALHALLAAGLTGTGLVVWLDDLDHYLGSDGLTTDVLDRFHDQGNVVVATIRSTAYKALLPVGDLRPPGWEVPGWFGDRVWLVSWTEDELNRAAATVPAKVLAGARQHGLSAYLGGGPLARDWLHTGETTDPLGYALVRTAADWRRIGVSSPVPEPVLVALVPVYIATARPRVDEEAVRQGLEWATRKINDTVALLETVNGGYSVLDYILDDLTARHPPIPRQTWDAALEHADSGDLVSVGYQAAVEHGQLDIAETAFRRSGADGNPAAMCNLGVLLEDRGELEAERWFRKAAELNLPAAMYNLGVLLVNLGEGAEAEQWWRKAAELDYPDAMTNLGVLLEDRGEDAEAEQWYRRAASLDFPGAMFNLGVLLESRGEETEAEQWYRRAARLDHPKAMFNLGVLLANRGERAEAKQWYRKADSVEHPTHPRNA